MIEFNQNIAIIDDGINDKIFNLYPIKRDVEITGNLMISQITDSDNSVQSHGTICAAIIKKYAPNSILNSIKILDNRSKNGEKKQLIKAIEWCVVEKIKLLNLSLGSIYFQDFCEIKECVNAAVKEGLIIVAACNNKDIYTMPASITNVIGVKCAPHLRENQFFYHTYPMDGIDLSASANHFLVDKNGKSLTTPYANSFSAPLITATVFNILFKNPELTLEQIKKQLSASAINNVDKEYSPYVCMFADWSSEYFIHKIHNTDMSVQADGIIVYIKQKDDTVKLISKINGSIFQSNGLHNKYWNQLFYIKRLIEELPNEKSCNIPIVLLYGEDTNEFLLSLVTLFNDVSYYAKAISINIEDLIYGCEYFPEEINIAKYLSYLNNLYVCDVFIIQLYKEEKFFRKICTQIDTDLVICNDNFIVYDESLIKSTLIIYKSIENTKRQTKQIFKNILKKLL